MLFMQGMKKVKIFYFINNIFTNMISFTLSNHYVLKTIHNVSIYVLVFDEAD